MKKRNSFVGQSQPSLIKATSIAGFFSKKQYAAIADKTLAMKLLKDQCPECSICAMFFSSSLTVSIKALFSEQNFIGYTHQGVPHVVLDLGDKLYAVKEKVLEQSLADIPLVGT